MHNRKLLATILIAIAAVLVGLGVTAAIKRQPADSTIEDELINESDELDLDDELLIEDEAALEDTSLTDEENVEEETAGDASEESADVEDFAPVNETVE
ncbi:MAG: hypothetical protein HY421_01045 [Candidatus Kerfeldbacteria bacterium]|nr:hypothetical protein [Candidatus Kerfeldbacteria bacterium]